jgi:hypothetical protein
LWPRTENGRSLSDQIASGCSIGAGVIFFLMKGKLHVVGGHVGFYDVMNLNKRQPEEK